MELIFPYFRRRNKKWEELNSFSISTNPCTAKQGLKALPFLILFLQDKCTSFLRISIVFVTQSLFKNHWHIKTFKMFNIQLWINQDENRRIDIFSLLLLTLLIYTDCRFDWRLTWLLGQWTGKFNTFTYESQIWNSVYKRKDIFYWDVLLSLWSKGKSSSEHGKIEEKTLDGPEVA